MQYAVCQVAAAPIRAENSDRSEMISQLLYGEKVVILEVKDNFTRIKCCYDDYEGWIDTKQVRYINANEMQQPTFCLKGIFFDLIGPPLCLSAGCDWDKEISKAPCGQDLRGNIVAAAHQFINAPYLWGGRSMFGVDCSGFSQVVYKINQIKLPRDAYQQAEMGFLRGLHDYQAGDLAFFANAQGRIIHVGLMLENHQIIHAHGKVRIDKIDERGIFNADLDRYTHQFSFIKNYTSKT